MPTYQYSAMDAQGKEQKGRIDADNENDANAKLKDRGLFPTSITESKGGAGGSRSKSKDKKPTGGGVGGMVIGTPKIKTKKLTIFTRQMATLLDAGLPLVRALRTLERQSKDIAEKRIIGDLANSVEGGLTFSEALAGQPKTFNRLYVNMVRAGEASGAMEQVLSRLAEYMEKSAALKAKVITALIYPVVVIFIATVITSLLLIFIVPKFAEMFEDMLAGEPLPALTRFVIICSNAIADPIRLIVIFIVIGFLSMCFVMLKRTRQGSYVIDLVLYKTPPFGTLVQKSSVARFCSTLGTLMDSGVSVLNALQIVRDTAGNEVVAQAVQVVHDAVKEGEGMAKPLESTKVFPVMVVSMIEVGEETGALPDMLQRVAKVYEMEVDMAVDGLTSLIEPLMIVILGVLIGGIVLAMFLPLIKLIERLG
jgi:type IV pilus assembly protein PilC